jgi:hypothetical protein
VVSLSGKKKGKDPGKCKDCSWFELSHQGVGFTEIGRCHRMPPSMLNKLTGNDEFPLVSGQDWCGEFHD